MKAPEAETRSQNSGFWASWISEQEEQTCAEYRRNPKRLLSDHRAEASVTADYVGREILELLQNAADAATEVQTHGCVHVELNADGLLVANTGAPFTRAGVDSLRLAHLSPKRRAQLVGCKGLGFRAVLNWSRFPFILSGDLVLGYSPEHARTKQEWLRSQSPELMAAIDGEASTHDALVLPLLSFPACPSNGDLTPLLTTDSVRGLLNRANELRQRFDTVIAMPFDRADAETHARKQIAQLRPEILLFAPGLSELNIRIANEPTLHWRRDPVETEVSRVWLDPDSRTCLEWHVKAERDRLPPEYCTDGPDALGYEVVVAVPVNHSAAPGFLYSYFPTEVRFPYAVIAHATVDLLSNRQQFQPTKANEFIMSRLAVLMAESAAARAGTHQDAAGLEMLVARGHHGEALQKLGFREKLIGTARPLALVPTLQLGIVPAADARHVIFDDTLWLPPAAFPAVAKTKQGSLLKPLLLELGVPPLGSGDWASVAKNLRFESIAERADFIAGALEYRVEDALRLPLLLDTEERTVDAGQRVFLSGPVERTHAVPEWLELRFLHVDLRAALERRLRHKDQAELVSKLGPLGVTRYSLDSLLSTLVARTNQRVRDREQEEHGIRTDLVRALHTLFPSEIPADERPRFPSDAKLLLLTQAGTFEDARSLYLGESYGAQGRILHGLYGAWAPAKLLPDPTVLGLLESADQLVEFFSWLGVAERPREIEEKQPDSKFRDHVTGSLLFPLQMDNDVIAEASDLYDVHLKEVRTIDGLEQILAKADSAAVLAWLAHDSRGLKWKFSSVEHGKFGNRPHRASNVRTYAGPIPSYVRWRLQTTAWLPLRDGTIARPQDCVAEAAGGLEELLPVPCRPDSGKLTHYGLPAVLVRDAFDRAGVIPGFSQLEPEQLYSLLLELPQREGEQMGRWARSVYRAILDHFDATDVTGSPAREKFRKQGQMWARSPEGERYCPVAQIWHVDSEDIPNALLKNLNVVALPKRSGSQKVAALFCVPAVERSQIIRRIEHVQPVVGADQFTDEIERLKPLLFLLRRTKTQASKLFRNLRVQICISIAGEMEFQGHRNSLELGPWDWILDDETQTAFVQADPSEPDPLRSDLMADAVGQIFAAVFRIERGDEFARLIGCKAKDRIKILRRLVGEEKLPELKEIERRYLDATADEIHEFQVPSSALQPQILIPPHTANPPEATQNPPALPPAQPGPPQPFEVQPQPHDPASASTIGCRVIRNQSTGPRTFSGARRVTNWVFCEYKAMEFEEKATPPRFPLRVSTVMGWKAPGVDLISFATSQDRDRFIAAENKDDVLVARFIEVKGTSSGNTRIDLRGNELTAAQKYRGRYYLYSVFDKHDGTYEMATLRDPLGDAKGVRPVIEVNLEAAENTEEYRITGGIHEDTYRAILPSPSPPQVPT
jgi:hypothetical protein